MVDLRAEVDEEWSARPPEERTEWIDAIAEGRPDAVLMSPVDRALVDFALKLTRTPGAMGEADVAHLRDAGLDDDAVHDAAQVVAYFNYINRIADAVDVELEPEYPPHPRRGGGSPGARPPGP